LSRLRISIVTPSFNHARFIERTIRSVLEQRGDFDLDYRVIDGGSADGTLEILRRYEGRLTWTSEPDQGQVDAVNKGLRAAKGEVVGWLNSDDTLLPGALERVAQAFASHPLAEWLHGRCEIIDVNDQPIRRWVSAYKDFRARRHSFENLLTENYVSQMTAFWRRRVHEEIGYLDPSLPFTFDYDLWLRLARRGPPVYLEERIACFRWYETSKSGANFERQFQEDAAVSARHAPNGRRSIGWRKRLKNVAILGAYGVMARMRRLRRGALT
jgi:glycosyltransferase involved in cell wall biosynthesis